MGKRFVPVRDADKRAVRLLQMVELAKEKLPRIGITTRRDDKMPIMVSDKDDLDNWDYFSVDSFLRLSVEQAAAAGGTYLAFVGSRSAIKPKLPQSEIDRAVVSFLDGEGDE